MDRQILRQLFRQIICLFYEFPDIFLNNLQYWNVLYCFDFNLKKKSSKKCLQSKVEYLMEYLTIHI